MPAELESRIAAALPSLPPDSPLAASAESFRCLLADAAQRLTQLKTDISTIASEAERHADAMQYGFLFVESRQLLSIGYDGVSHELHSACYDLLASEARIASFIAVAKGDIPQQSWFRLDRSHVLVNGRPALLSWTRHHVRIHDARPVDARPSPTPSSHGHSSPPFASSVTT